MVTLKRLMNVMALSVLLGAVSTPVMVKASFAAKSWGALYLASGSVFAPCVYEQGKHVVKIWTEIMKNHNSVIETISEGIKAGTKTAADMPIFPHVSWQVGLSTACSTACLGLLAFGTGKLLVDGLDYVTSDRR